MTPSVADRGSTGSRHADASGAGAGAGGWRWCLWPASVAESRSGGRGEQLSAALLCDYISPMLILLRNDTK